MANQLSPKTQEHLVASMALQLNAQAQQLAELEQQLKKANQRLKSVNKELEVKSRYNECLELDLEHAIHQLKRIQTRGALPSQAMNTNLGKKSPQWISRPVPGLSATA